MAAITLPNSGGTVQGTFDDCEGCGSYTIYNDGNKNFLVGTVQGLQAVTASAKVTYTPPPGYGDTLYQRAHNFVDLGSASYQGIATADADALCSGNGSYTNPTTSQCIQAYNGSSNLLMAAFLSTGGGDFQFTVSGNATVFSASGAIPSNTTTYPNTITSNTFGGSGPQLACGGTCILYVGQFYFIDPSPPTSLTVTIGAASSAFPSYVDGLLNQPSGGYCSEGTSGGICGATVLAPCGPSVVDPDYGFDAVGVAGGPKQMTFPVSFGGVNGVANSIVSGSGSYGGSPLSATWNLTVGPKNVFCYLKISFPGPPPTTQYCNGVLYSTCIPIAGSTIYVSNTIFGTYTALNPAAVPQTVAVT